MNGHIATPEATSRECAGAVGNIPFDCSKMSRIARMRSATSSINARARGSRLQYLQRLEHSRISQVQSLNMMCDFSEDV